MHASKTKTHCFVFLFLIDFFSCDRGGDCECLCTALASFAEKCNTIGVPVKWRRPDGMWTDLSSNMFSERLFWL
jgi:hypothetical protein